MKGERRRKKQKREHMTQHNNKKLESRGDTASKDLPCDTASVVRGTHQETKMITILAYRRRISRS